MYLKKDASYEFREVFNDNVYLRSDYVATKSIVSGASPRR